MHSIIVIGARGYTGAELLPLLHCHPEFELAAVGSGSAAGEPVHAHVAGMEDSDLVFTDIRPDHLESLQADACVLALPNGAAAPYVAALGQCPPETVIVDLSADHRFDPTWVYGQPERFAGRIRGARRIANPGCYATAAQLAVAPLLGELAGPVTAFGVSGYSGAGTAPSRRNDPEVLADNLLPYALVDHVHEREVSHHTGHDVRLLPHVAPFFRGISLTVAFDLQCGRSEEELMERFTSFYADCPLVEIRAAAPEVKEVRGTHGVILGGFAVSGNRTSRVALVAVLDNLLKGAATQAVQNLNLAFGFDGLAGLDLKRKGPGGWQA
jgi:N-acetyl-gamma-glutamyl-phosphate reductase